MMKKNFEQFIKAAVAIMFICITTSSCVVRTKAHRPPPPPTEKIIIKP